MTTPTRPTFPEEMFEEISRPEEEKARMRAEFEASLDAMEARGPFTLEFADDARGVVIGYDLSTDENIVSEARGTLRFDTYTDVSAVELYHPTAEQIAALPPIVLEWCEIHGCDDDAFRALVARPEAKLIMVTPVVTDEPEAADELEDADESEAADESEGSAEEAAGQEEGDTAESSGGIDENYRPAPGGSPISDAAFAELAKRSDITDIQVRATRAEDATIAAVLAAQPDLARLSLSSEVARFDQLDALAGRSMDFIAIGGPEITAEALASFPSMPELPALAVHGDRLGDGEIDAAALHAAVPNLEYLRITDSNDVEIPLEKTLVLRAYYPDAEINDVHYSPKAVARLAKKHGITLPTL